MEVITRARWVRSVPTTTQETRAIATNDSSESWKTCAQHRDLGFDDRPVDERVETVGLIRTPAVAPEDDDSDDCNDRETVALISDARKEAIEATTYTDPTINMSDTVSFFRRGNCSWITSYTGMTIKTKSTKMFTRQLTRMELMKLIHLPGSSFIQPVHVKRVGKQRKESTNAQVIPMAALVQMSAYARYRKVRDWKMRRRKRHTEILAREI